jgi:hypothetical protein
MVIGAMNLFRTSLFPDCRGSAASHCAGFGPDNFPGPSSARPDRLLKYLRSGFE